MNTSKKLIKVIVIGGGLAGVEAAGYLANHGIEVVLFEGKKLQSNPSQTLPGLAELVCTNSLKSMNEASAHGLLKIEMNKLGSTILNVAQETAVPAGDALAVDRAQFSARVTEVISTHPLITLKDEVVTNPLELQEKLQADYVIVATGPLSYGGIDDWMQSELSDVKRSDLYFYDAIAPIVDADSLDLDKLYFKDRHKDEGSGDYLNIPLTEEEYYSFIKELVGAKKVPPKAFEEYKFFESCLPVDTMAERGKDTARFSCMKPIGLENGGEIPFAAVQLRKENLLGDAYNLVGFQTKLTYSEQKRVFRMLPGMQNAEFLHLGSIHRNSFLHSKRILNHDFSSQKYPNLFFAGQITGVEGYTESAAIGLYVAEQIVRRNAEQDFKRWPVETCIGALVNYVMSCEKPRPSNINFGLLPTVLLTKEQRRDRKNRKRIKKGLVSVRAQQVFDEFYKEEIIKC